MSQPVAAAAESFDDTVVAPPNRAWPLRTLVWGHLLLTLLTATVATLRYFMPVDWIDFITAGMPMAQVSLLAFWLAMGTDAAWKRLLVTLAACAAITLFDLAPAYVVAELLMYPFSWGDQYEWLLGYNTLIAAFQTANLYVVRRSFELKRVTSAPVSHATQRWQFSLRDLFLFVLILAAQLAVVRWAVVRGEIRDADRFFSLLLMSVTWSIVPASMALATLTHGRVWRRTAITLVAITLLGAAALFPRAPTELWQILVAAIHLWLFSSILVAASLLVVRWCGYRLMKAVKSEETG